MDICASLDVYIYIYIFILYDIWLGQQNGGEEKGP